ncbi:hypothetical protein M758_11G123400 [Ceratodon purpureus]|uniref:Glutathione S-transferase kappa n=1 Tax=Ceratodon purpureus TaxID=3225 RepID=A0A8T0GEE4_CERPU|nr:hypothetical protein KC19_11G127700 [Ceratodon purpureus]KAG0601580.1 hypothetical protein M758_11G123400 [Ceratodon purpureus]
MENSGDGKVHMLVCLDALSPYSFFGLSVLLRYQEKWNLHLKFLPVLLGAVQKATGNKPPGALPARAKWLAEDTERNARFMGVPFRGVPKGFGISLDSMRCQRVLTAIAESKGYDSKELAGAFMAFFRALFSVGLNHEVAINDPSFLVKCCVSAGFTEAEAEQYVRASDDAATKQRLKENTELAVTKGMFGAPTIYVSPVDKSKKGAREMMFFGSDRFEQMAWAIGKPWEGPNPPRSKL